MTFARRTVETIFRLVETLVTAALYPWCVLGDLLGGPLRVPVLMYHQVAMPGRGEPSPEDRVSPETFERQVLAILAAGFRVISLADLIRALDEGAREDLRRSVVLTFDDGYRGQFAFAYPVLRRHRLPATFFLVAGQVGSWRPFPHLGIAAAEDPTETAEDGDGGQEGPSPAWLPLSWDEAREMRGRGIEVGSHAVTHRSLGALDADAIDREVLTSREILERRLEGRVDLFAYPFGSKAYGDFDDRVRRSLRRAGYRCGCTTVVGRVGPGCDRFSLPRIPMEERDGPFRVRCKLLGAYDWIGPVKTLWQRLVPREDRVDVPLPAGADREAG